MDIFWRELKANRNSMIVWTASLSIMVVVFMSLYPSFANDVDAMKKILSNLPAFISSAIGVSIDSLFSIYGFLSYLFTFITLAGAVQAMNLGVGILSKEESGKTADFLLTKPISRASVVTSKILASVVVLLVTNIFFVSTAVMMAVVVTTTDFRLDTFLLVSAKLILIQTIFMALGLIVSMILKKIKSSIAVSLPTVFAFFIIGTLGAVLEIDSVKYISPFKFFDSNYIISNNAYEASFLIITAVFVVAAVAATYWMFIKKDIRSAS